MWQWILGILVSIFLIIYGLFKYYTGNKYFWPKNNVYFLDMDNVIPFWDRMSFKIPFHLMEYQMYQALKNVAKEPQQQQQLAFGGIMEFRKPLMVILDLELIKSITVKDFDHFVNRRAFSKAGSDNFSEDMLINKEDQEWRDLRSTLSPTFTTGKIKRMFDVFNESGGKLVKFLDQEILKCDPADGIDVRDCMIRFTLDVIASAAFGFDSQIFKDKNSPFSKWSSRLQNPFSGLKFIKLIFAIFAPKILTLLKISLVDKEALDFFTDVISQTIKQRESTSEKRNDFIQLLIEAKNVDLKNDEDDEKDVSTARKSEKMKTPLTDKLILSQALLFFFAGFDTMETLLIFAIYELGLNPEVQEKLFQEIHEVMNKNNGNLEYEAVNRMEYLDKVISETLRKYPPAIRTERQCTQDYKLPNSNFVLKKGTLVVIPMYGIHHDEEYYPKPKKFDPERFSPEIKASRHPYAYIPFGTGPRNCIAMRFALIEGKAALAHLVHKFMIEPSQKTSIPLKCGKVTGFKPEGGMWFKLTRR